MSHYNASACRLGSSHASLKHNSTTTVDGRLPTNCPVTRNMKHLLKEFKGLYEERLRRIDFDTEHCTEEEMLRMKVGVLLSYVNDLGDQNQVLVQTVEDLDKEANDKVASLEVKLRTSDEIITDLDQQRRTLEESVCVLRSENQDVRSDLASLGHLVQEASRIRSLDVSGVELRTVTPKERIVPASTHISDPEDGTRSAREEREAPGAGLRRKEDNVGSLEKKGRNERQGKTRPFEASDASECLRRQVSALESLQREKVTQVTERDLAIAKLHTHITLLQRDEASTHTLLSEQEERMKGLQEEKRKIEEALKEREEEHKKREEGWRKKEEEWRRREEEERRRQEEEERRKEEQRKNRKEEQREREEEWRRREEEQKEVQNRTVGELQEEAAILNAEVETRQREILDLHQKEKSLLSELQAQENRLSEAQKESRVRGEEVLRLQSQLEDRQNTHTLTTRQAETQMAAWRSELGAESERRLAEEEARTRRTTEELNALREKHATAREQVCVLQRTVSDQAERLRETEQRYQESVEDGGRLRVRLEAHTLSAHSQQEVLTSQLSDTESVLQALRMQLQERERHLEEATHKIFSLEDALREAERGRLSARADTQDRGRLLAELERLTHAEKDAVLEVSERGERLRHLQRDLAATHTAEESARRTLGAKERQARQLAEENARLRETLALLENKLQASEERVSDAGAEVSQVRTRLAEETNQREQLQNQVLQRAEDLETLRQQLRHTSRTAAKKIHKREAKLSAALRELSECKQQYSDCQNESLSRQRVLVQLQEDAAQIRSKMEEQSQECSALYRDRDRLEADLALTNQKHCAAQKEVSSRDQQILQLKAELRTAEQKQQGVQEEVALLEAEVSRLNRKVKVHQEEACHLWGQVRDGEGLRDQEEGERLQLHNQLAASQQQVKSQAQSIDQLTSDLEAVKQAHRTDQERWSQRNFLLHSQLEQAGRELGQSQAGVRERGLEVKGLGERLNQAEAGLQEAMEKVEVSEGSLRKRDAENDLLRQQLNGAREDLKETTARAQGQEETAAIFKQKYSAAMEKVRQLQQRTEGVEEELRYAQQQLREAKEEVGGASAALAELEGRYQEKVGQWESSEEALEQLTEALRESQERERQRGRLVADLQQQLDALKQQMVECDSALRSYQKGHSHSDEDHSRLQRQMQLLQKRCTEQVERVVVCEQTLVQMRSEMLRKEEELERRSQEQAVAESTLQSLHLNVAAAQRTHLATRTHLEEEVTRLQREVARLGQDLAGARHTCAQREQEVREQEAFLQRCEEDLKESREVLERRSRELQEQERERREEQQESQTHVTQLKEEMEELLTQHRDTVEELAMRGGEVWRLEGSLRERRLAEEKRRLAVDRLEREAQELRLALHQATEETVNTHRDRNDAQKQLDTLRLELEGARSDNAQLRQESQLVMSNVNHWIKEQRVSNENLAAQIRTQNKVLIIITEEKEHLQEANDSLKEELRKQREEREEKERGMEEERETAHLKVQVQDGASKQQEDNRGRESCVVHNLSKLQDMQVRLQTNLEAIALLNQQLSALGGENEGLHRQLEEERARRRRAERLTPPCGRPQRHASARLALPLSLSVHPPSSSTSPSILSSPLPLRHAPSPGPGEADGELTRAELTADGPPAPGESQAVDEAYWTRRAGGALCPASRRLHLPGGLTYLT